MIRVAFVLSQTGSAWVGGLNYYRNLFRAVDAIPDRPIEPVAILATRTTAAAMASFPPLEVTRTSLLDRFSGKWFRRQIASRVLGTDALMDALLQSRHIDVLSHSGQLGRNARTPTIAWIPDLQHRYYPDLFDARDRARRDAGFRLVSRYADRIIVSSEAARRDLARFYPEGADRARVVRFVDCSASASTPGEALGDLERRYGFRGAFVLLPNQFWAHKNHGVVIRAVAELARRNRRILVLATGSRADYRQPRHYEQLMKMRSELGVQDEFRTLGVVPYQDLASLMRHSVALLNPSLFEGWSTTVEEGKALGKTVILSDIPVHREQAPEHGVYFDPTDVAALAEALWSVWSAYEPEKELARMARAEEQRNARVLEFGRSYERVVREVVT